MILYGSKIKEYEIHERTYLCKRRDEIELVCKEREREREREREKLARVRYLKRMLAEISLISGKCVAISEGCAWKEIADRNDRKSFIAESNETNFKRLLINVTYVLRINEYFIPSNYFHTQTDDLALETNV